MSRVSKLQAAIKAKKMDAMLVTSQYNLRYVSNFTGTTGLAVITQEEAFFVTDFRYTQQAASQAQGFQIIQNKGPIFDEVKKIVEVKGHFVSRVRRRHHVFPKCRRPGGPSDVRSASCFRHHRRIA